MDPVLIKRGKYLGWGMTLPPSQHKDPSEQDVMMPPLQKHQRIGYVTEERNAEVDRRVGFSSLVPLLMSCYKKKSSAVGLSPLHVLSTLLRNSAAVVRVLAPTGLG